MMKLAQYLKPYTLSMIALFALLFGQVMTHLQLPDYMASIVNEGIIRNNNALILSIGLKMLLISLLGGVCAVGFGYLASRIATGFAMNVRDEVFAKVESFSLREF